MPSFRYARRVALSLAAMLLPAAVHAQGGQIELRVDPLSLSTTSDRLSIAAVIPGVASLAYYVSPNIAIESRIIGISYNRADLPNGSKFSGTNVQAGVFLPIHFGTSRGRRGLFVAPGIMVSKSWNSSNLSIEPRDADISYGIDLGFKRALHERVSLRSALTYRNGGPLVATYGATAGISLFFR